jgi:hypothetical protein
MVNFSAMRSNRQFAGWRKNYILAGCGANLANKLWLQKFKYRKI